MTKSLNGKKPGPVPGDPDRTLSAREQLFVDSYIKADYNATEAARMAGYAKNSPHNMTKISYQIMQRPHIKKALEGTLSEKRKSVSVSVEFVLQKLIKTVQKAEEDNNHSATLRGLELMARHLGMLTDKTEITGKDGQAIKYEEISNDAADFASTIAGLATRSGETEVPLRLVPGGKGST